MAKEEIQTLKDSLPALEKEVSLLLLPKDKDDNASIVLEIRAGTGGDEAAIFAGDLFSMYSRYASLQWLESRNRNGLRSGYGRLSKKSLPPFPARAPTG